MEFGSFRRRALDKRGSKRFNLLEAYYKFGSMVTSACTTLNMYSVPEPQYLEGKWVFGIEVN